MSSEGLSVGDSLLLASNALWTAEAARASHRTADEVAALRMQIHQQMAEIQRTQDALEVLFRCKQWLGGQAANLPPILQAAYANTYSQVIRRIETRTLPTISDKDLHQMLLTRFAEMMAKVPREDVDDATWMLTYGPEEHRQLRNKVLHWELTCRKIEPGFTTTERIAALVMTIVGIALGFIAAAEGKAAGGGVVERGFAVLFFGFLGLVGGLLTAALSIPVAVAAYALTAAAFYLKGGWWGGAAVLATVITAAVRAMGPKKVSAAQKRVFDLFGVGHSEAQAILNEEPALPPSKHRLPAQYAANTARYNRISEKVFGPCAQLTGLPDKLHCDAQQCHA